MVPVPGLPLASHMPVMVPQEPCGFPMLGSSMAGFSSGDDALKHAPGTLLYPTTGGVDQQPQQMLLSQQQQHQQQMLACGQQQQQQTDLSANVGRPARARKPTDKAALGVVAAAGKRSHAGVKGSKEAFVVTAAAAAAAASLEGGGVNGNGGGHQRRNSFTPALPSVLEREDGGLGGGLG